MARGTAVAGGQTGARLDGGRGTIGQAPGRGGGGGGGKGKGKGRGSRGGGRGRGASAAAGSKGGGAGGAGGKGASGVSGVSDAARHAANVRVADRLRSYAAYAVSQPDQQRQDMTLRSAAKGVSAADELVVDAASAQRCRGVGPKLSQRIVAFLDWATAAAAAPPTAVGRWENADESKWWRVEWVAKGDGGSIVRRSYGSLDVPGFEEAFKPFTNAEARETVIQKFVRDKERAERYVRCAADCGDAASIEQVPDRDTAPHEEARTIHEELADLRGDDPLEALAEARERAALRGVARGAAIRGKQYDPRLLNKAGSLQAVSAILVAMHRHRVRHPDDGCMTKDQ
ncbi:hypothetical protein M885DRAFT_504841 [Pelagophyceae sp. CCMP2097]|nr:hypothetical protein M885DRAFT_504841 [Pelagophyceae sp. CCMP2097]